MIVGGLKRPDFLVNSLKPEKGNTRCPLANNVQG